LLDPLTPAQVAQLRTISERIADALEAETDEGTAERDRRARSALPSTPRPAAAGSDGQRVAPAGPRG
jgi:hypothetical protein